MFFPKTISKLVCCCFACDLYEKSARTMSFFGKIFGGSKPKAVWDTNEAVQNLRKMEEMLIKKQDYLEQSINKEIEVAKKNGSKDKRGTTIIV